MKHKPFVLNENMPEYWPAREALEEISRQMAIIQKEQKLDMKFHLVEPSCGSRKTRLNYCCWEH